MINIFLKRKLPAYQSSHYTAKVNCLRGGWGSLNHEKVSRPSTCLLTTGQTRELNLFICESPHQAQGYGTLNHSLCFYVSQMLR